MGVLTARPALVMISGYYSDLYAERLADWSHIEFTAPTRGGPAQEHLWFNFDPPTALHDYQYLGRNFRERERIKKKAARWRNRFAALPDLERQAILSAVIAETDDTGRNHQE